MFSRIGRDTRLGVPPTFYTRTLMAVHFSKSFDFDLRVRRKNEITLTIHNDGPYRSGILS